jgi:hypothetical protein
MRWPFAWRSTVEALTVEVDMQKGELNTAYQRTADSWANAALWHHELKLAQKRVIELIDAERTSPETMAAVFSEWTTELQAAFFNKFGELSAEWGTSKVPGSYQRCFQFAHMAPDLNEVGRELLIELASYAETTP